jgi:RNA polymerase sigma-70 factor (ECF subfamily)
MRLDPRLIGRIDASDIVQETYLEASRRLPEYLRDTEVPIFLWLRFLTNQRITAAHRTHLGAEKRSARREADATRMFRPSAEKDALSFEFSGRLTSPSLAAARREMQDSMHDIMSSLEPMDREILSLRHFEELSNTETARELRISPAAASKRYIRALERLRAVAQPLADYCDVS